MSTLAVTAVTLLSIALLFGGAAYLGIELSNALGARLYRDRERNPFPRSLTYALCSGSAVLGAVAGLGRASWQALALAAIVCVSLAAAWHAAVVFGKIPDFFTLVPLGAVLVAAAAQGEWFLIVGAVVPFAAFAAMAYFTKGRGFDWDDAKIAGLGGAILGLYASIFALAVACIVAVAIAFGRKRTKEPIVMAPYLIGAIGAALAWRLLP